MLVHGLTVRRMVDRYGVADEVAEVEDVGGPGGGKISAQGTPEEVSRQRGSQTGRYLKGLLAPARAAKARSGRRGKGRSRA